MGAFDPAGIKRSRPRPWGLVYWRLEIQIPPRSGWPSEARGAGALRLGLPSLVRGVPGKGTLTHWACAVKARPMTRKKLVTKFDSFIRALSLQHWLDAFFCSVLTPCRRGVNHDGMSPKDFLQCLQISST